MVSVEVGAGAGVEVAVVIVVIMQDVQVLRQTFPMAPLLVMQHWFR